MKKCSLKVDPIARHKNYEKEIYNAYCERKKKHPGLGAPSVFYPGKDTVVTIYGSVYLHSSPSGTPRLYTPQFTGYFIDPLTIVTCAHNVLVPSYDGSDGNTRCDANGVDLPFPVDPENPSVQATNIQRLEKFQVVVSNPNFCGDAYVYNAKLIGLSPSLDIAVLKIDQVYGRGCAQPLLEKHNTLEWGDSRCTVIGEEIFILGSSSNSETVGLNAGIVVDNLYADNLLRSTEYPVLNENRGNGYWGFEAIISDANVTHGNSGSPVLNADGRVIGMVVGIDTTIGHVARTEVPISENDTDPQVSGEDEFFAVTRRSRVVIVTSHILRRVVRAIACGDTDPCLGGHLQTVNDVLGDFYRYKYAWLQIQGFEAYNPNFFYYVPNPEYRKQKGFIITEADANGPIGSLAELYVTFQYPPSGNPVPPTVGNDIMLITAINNSPVGVGAGQLPMSSITFMHTEGERMVVEYRLGSENFRCAHPGHIIGSYLPLDADFPPRYTNTVSGTLGARARLNKRERDLAIASREFNINNVLKALTDPEVHSALSKILAGILKVGDKVGEVVEKVGDEVEDIIEAVGDVVDSAGDIVDKVNGEEEPKE